MNQLTIWYDGACPLCTREIALMKRLDKQGAIQFLDGTDDNIICPIDRDIILARFHARENGQMLSGAAAFAAMWRAIPLLRPLGLIARFKPILWALEWLYTAFLKVRPRIQNAMKGKSSI